MNGLPAPSPDPGRAAPRHTGPAIAGNSGREHGGGRLEERLRVPLWPFLATTALLSVLVAAGLSLEVPVRISLIPVNVDSETITATVPAGWGGSLLDGAPVTVRTGSEESAGTVTDTREKRIAGSEQPVTVVSVAVEDGSFQGLQDGVSHVLVEMGSRPILHDILRNRE